MSDEAISEEIRAAGEVIFLLIWGGPFAMPTDVAMGSKVV